MLITKYDLQPLIRQEDEIWQLLFQQQFVHVFVLHIIMPSAAFCDSHRHQLFQAALLHCAQAWKILDSIRFNAAISVRHGACLKYCSRFKSLVVAMSLETYWCSCLV